MYSKELLTIKKSLKHTLRHKDGLCRDEAKAIIAALQEVENLITGDTIADYWTIENVHSCNEDRQRTPITNEEARRVLITLNDNGYGLTWEGVADTVDDMFPEKEETYHNQYTLNELNNI